MLNFAKRWKKRYAWWDTCLGQVFLEAETTEVKKMLPQLFGYHLMILGESVFIPAVKTSPILHHVWIHPESDQSKLGSPIFSRHDKLPIINDGVDLVYLAHSLEFIKNPHEVLREVFRILIPEGHVIITNFNPWSLWGLWRSCVRFIKRPAWDSQFISVGRLKDWLALLGFDVLKVKTFCFRPPISHSGFLERLAWLEKLGRWCWPFFGGGYVVLAQKRVVTLTPIRPIFVERRKLLVPSGIEPVRSE